jgi:NADPH:quinone reductase-like Zn-dependent oxidoreductase
MRVIEVTRAGGPEVLQLVERPDPTPGPGEAVVRIAAANVNPTDLGARRGHGPRAMPDPPYVLGWDFAGEVVAVGDLSGHREDRVDRRLRVGDHRHV